MLHDVVIYSVYGFRSDAFAIVANSLSAYGLIGTPLCLTSLAMRRHVAWAWAAARAAAGAAAAIASSSASPCAAETNQASKTDGGRPTPASRKAWKKGP